MLNHSQFSEKHHTIMMFSTFLTIWLCCSLFVSSKDYIVTPEFVTFRQDLSAKEVMSGMNKARALVKKAKNQDLSPKDRIYLDSQLVGSVYRLDRADEKMKMLGLKSKVKRETSWNPFPSLLKPIFGAIGVESTIDAEESNKRLDAVEKGTEELAGSLSLISKHVAQGLQSVDYNIKLLVNSTKFQKQVSRVKSHLEQTILSIEHAQETFLEIEDRADQNMISRNVVSREMLLEMNSDGNDRYPDLHPIYSKKEVRNYYKLPIATTGYSKEEEKFSTLVHIPLRRSSDIFHTIENHPGFMILENKDWKAMMLHEEFFACVDAGDDVLCAKRACKISRRYEGAISSCILNNEQDDVEIVVNSTELGESLQLEILCIGQQRQEITAKGQVFHFNLPKNCRASNDFITIENVMTSKLETAVFAERAINVKAFDMKEIRRGHPKIRNKATHTVVEDLLQESKDDAKLEESLKRSEESFQRSEESFTISNFLAMKLYGLGGIVLVGFIILTIFF